LAVRRVLPIETVPLVGGALCLNFVNTTGARDLSQPRERLKRYRDVLTFCSRTGLMQSARLRALSRVCERNPRAARRALAHLIAVREVLYRIFVAVVKRATPGAADLAAFNAELAAAKRLRQLTLTRGVPRWSWAGQPDDLEQMLGPILLSAAELLGSPQLASLKQCGACVWLFLDSTRNHSRRWCKNLCGDRVKSRRYYQRHKGKARSSPS